MTDLLDWIIEEAAPNFKLKIMEFFWNTISFQHNSTPLNLSIPTEKPYYIYLIIISWGDWCVVHLFSQPKFIIYNEQHSTFDQVLLSYVLLISWVMTLISEFFFSFFLALMNFPTNNSFHLPNIQGLKMTIPVQIYDRKECSANSNLTLHRVYCADLLTSKVFLPPFFLNNQKMKIRGLLDQCRNIK